MLPDVPFCVTYPENRGFAAQVVEREGATEHPSERTRRCVSEGAQGATPAIGRISGDPI